MIENDRDLEAALDVLRGHVGDVEITDVVRPSGGWGNLSYRTDTSAGRFIVTRCMARLESEILEMADLLVHLENVGFPSPRLVPHRDGRILSEWDGCPALVKRYIEGDIPRGIVENDPRDFGEIVARFHAATDNHPITRPHEFGRTAFPTAGSLASTEPFAAWLGTMAERFEIAIDPMLRSGLVHGDLTLDNLVRSPGGALSIIDLEDICHEVLIFDLGMIVFTLAEAAHWSENLERGVVEGYERVRTLDPGELEAVPLFVSYAATAIAFVRFRERRLDRGSRVPEGAWVIPQRIADTAWARFDGT